MQSLRKKSIVYLGYCPRMNELKIHSSPIQNDITYNSNSKLNKSKGKLTNLPQMSY